MLKRALALCRKNNATLIIATLDRLARNVGFIVRLMESGIDFIVADRPYANRWELLRQAIDDEEEGFKISARTKKALQRAKARGVELGKNGKVLAKVNKENADAFALALIPRYKAEWSDGHDSEAKLMRRFNVLGILSPRGNEWGVATIHALLVRMRRLESEASNDNHENIISSHQMTGT